MARPMCTSHRASRPGRSIVPNDVWALSGTWTVGPEGSVAGRNAQNYIRFRAAKVHIVAGPTSDAIGTIEPPSTAGAGT